MRAKQQFQTFRTDTHTKTMTQFRLNVGQDEAIVHKNHIHTDTDYTHYTTTNRGYSDVGDYFAKWA